MATSDVQQLTADRQAAAERRAHPLPLGHKLGYAVGQVIEGAALNSLTIFLLFYLTSVCGLPGGLAGAALAIGLVVDAVLDPVIGSVSDNLCSRLGRRVPMMMIGLPLVALSFVAIFSLPTGWTSMALFAWVSVISVTMRVALSLFMLPYSAASAELTDDGRSRSSVMAWRWSMGMFGMLIAMLLAFQVFLSGPKGLADRAGYSPFAIAVAALVVISGLVSMKSIAANRDRAHPARTSSAGLMKRLLGELREIFKNQSFRTVFLTGLLFYWGAGVQASLALHANSYFWRLPPAAVQLLTLAIVVGFLMGAPIAGPLLKRIENRTMMLIGLWGVTVCGFVPPALRVMGLFPFEGGVLIAILAIAQVFGCALLACAAIATSSMMADAADEHEYLFGTRREAMFFAGTFFSSKAAQGAGTLVAGLVLQFVALPSAETIAKSGGVAPEKALMLGVAFALIPAFLVGASAINASFYRISKARHREILAGLAQRRVVTPQSAG